MLGIATIVLLLGACAGLAACGGASQGAVAAGDCPTAPIPVVVTVSQWGDIVKRLAGDCASVTTIVSSDAADPHDYEPSPADIASLGEARLVVENGLGYDSWADKALAATSSRPAVVDAGAVAGLAAGDNPHIWYSPDDVVAVADTIAAELRKELPGAAGYLSGRSDAWLASLEPYRAEVAALGRSAAGKTYAATEPVFDDLARSIGLVDATPAGYRDAVANDAEPAPGDVNDLLEALGTGTIDVLVFNTQTEGSLSGQIRAEAEKASVPVVDVTEGPPESVGFVDWQVDQLRRLAEALGG